jgi:glutamate formiminotransferase
VNWVECVPNFSEGQDAETLRALAAVMRPVLLGHEADTDHNRSVFTLAGEPEAVLEAVVQAVGVAVERIDLTRQQGEHPRIGAADVVPFVPLGGTTMADCAALAHRAGALIWERFGVGVYFYEAAALRPERQRLEQIRRGQRAVGDPDIGSPHPTAGASVVGARKFLIAYNINLASDDLEIAKAIARKIRTSSGGLPHLKAMGVMLGSKGQAQVSMNLTDFEVTTPGEVYATVEREARARGVEIDAGELIGFVPRRAVELGLRAANLRPESVLEHHLE